MCGIAGFIDQQKQTCSGTGSLLATCMADKIAHRGPDDFGVWSDADAGVFIAHRRLSILDLSPAGHQPMASASGRYVMAFNGEIYNHAELRLELEAMPNSPAWRGRSDTEVLLAALEQWGLRATLPRIVGMFAIALWDRQTRELMLVRDRVGEKPLYYGQYGGILLFASELKAIRAHPAFSNEVDRNAMRLFLTYGYIPAPYTIYRDVRKVEPGTLVRILTASGQKVVDAYWSASGAVVAGQREPWAGSDSQALIELERLIGQSISLQMVADVPVGAFLSGGIDSTLVVALAQQLSMRPIRTFAIGFAEDAYNEARHAAAVARHLGTDHTELYVSASDAMAAIPRLPQIYDEPFGDPSQIPTFLVAQLARKHVTVSLSGDGGDELFAGYNRYFMGERIWRAVRVLPKFVRRIASRSLMAVGPTHWDGLLKPFASLVPLTHRLTNMGDKLHRLGGLLLAEPEDVYRDLVSHWKVGPHLVKEAAGVSTRLDDPCTLPHLSSFVERGAWLDMVTYLPDDILVKVDRAAMAVSLESRIPLLDHRVIEFAWRLPMKMKYRGGKGKWLLRQLLYGHVPKALLDRPKMGFSIPLDSWLRGPLREWSEELVSEARLRREGFFEPGPIREKWREHLSGKRNWQFLLWDVLMFQAWLECNVT